MEVDITNLAKIRTITVIKVGHGPGPLAWGTGDMLGADMGTLLCGVLRCV